MITKKTLLFTMIALLSLLNKSTCNAMKFWEKPTINTDNSYDGKTTFNPATFRKYAEQQTSKNPEQNKEEEEEETEEFKNYKQYILKQLKLDEEKQKELQEAFEQYTAKKKKDAAEEQLKYAQATAPSIQATYGSKPSGPGTADAAEAELTRIKGQSLEYNNYYVATRDIAGGINQIAAPIIVHAADPIITELRQKYIYMTEIEKSEMRLRELQAKKTQSAIDVDKAQAFNVEANTLASSCSKYDNPNSSLKDEIAIFRATQKARLEKMYEEATGKKYTPSR